MHGAMEAFGPPLIQFRFVTTHLTSLNSLPSLHRLFFIIKIDHFIPQTTTLCPFACIPQLTRSLVYMAQ